MRKRKTYRKRSNRYKRKRSRVSGLLKKARNINQGEKRTRKSNERVRREEKNKEKGNDKDSEPKGSKISVVSGTPRSESQSKRSKKGSESEKEDGEDMVIYDESGVVVIERLRDLMGRKANKTTDPQAAIDQNKRIHNYKKVEEE